MLKQEDDCDNHEAHVLWGEIAPCASYSQLIESDESVLDWLESFVSSGFKMGESVIVVASKQRLDQLYARLIKRQGFSIEKLKISKQYLAISAEQLISKFMVKGWPDERLFKDTISGMVGRASCDGSSNVRAYSELVATIWGQGLGGSTVRMQYLWEKLVTQEKLCIFCAFPKTAFTQSIQSSIKLIATTHSQAAGRPMKPTVVVYP